MSTTRLLPTLLLMDEIARKNDSAEPTLLPGWILDDDIVLRAIACVDSFSFRSIMRPSPSWDSNETRSCFPKPRTIPTAGMLSFRQSLRHMDHIKHYGYHSFYHWNHGPVISFLSRR